MAKCEQVVNQDRGPRRRKSGCICLQHALQNI